jgi:hypothetical protein
VDQHADRSAAREHGRRERAYFGGVAHVRAQELRRTAGGADRLGRRISPRLVVPDNEDSAPSLASSIAAKRPIPREAPVNRTVLPFMLQPVAASWARMRPGALFCSARMRRCPFVKTAGSV